jgi:hypothetical protein
MEAQLWIGALQGAMNEFVLRQIDPLLSALLGTTAKHEWDGNLLKPTCDVDAIPHLLDHSAAKRLDEWAHMFRSNGIQGGQRTSLILPHVS